MITFENLWGRIKGSHQPGLEATELLLVVGHFQLGVPTGFPVSIPRWLQGMENRAAISTLPLDAKRLMGLTLSPAINQAKF